jgi:hypothetical protein
MDQFNIFYQCRNCGKYYKIDPDKKISNTDKIYCSQECSSQYQTCTVCGKYFNQENTTFNTAKEPYFCSKECSEVLIDIEIEKNNQKKKEKK